MNQETETPKTLADFREATMELDHTYARFPKACGLSEAEYWSLLLFMKELLLKAESAISFFSAVRP